jgi:glycosyltransferase involved in cell wall biosynthesis
LPQDWVPVITGAREFGENAPSHPGLRVENPPRIRPGRLQKRFNRTFWSPRMARQAQLLHPTYYDLSSDFRWSDFSCPVVVTVHDMIYARFPQQTDGSAEIILAQRESVLRANRVVCVSKSTENELLELIPEAAGKTTVIHHGCSFSRIERPAEQDLFEQPTFLWVGYRGGYKNFLFLLRAFARAASVVSTIRLQVVGPALTSEERWQMHFLGITGKVSCSVYPDEAALHQLYRKSVALVYPSRYEGFGMPPLEAMSCGTIAVTANTTSLPEVVGDGGIMLDPTDEAAWVDNLIKLSSPFPERAKLLERGRNRVKQFSWTECARRHVGIYKELSL